VVAALLDAGPAAGKRRAALERKSGLFHRPQFRSAHNPSACCAAPAAVMARACLAQQLPALGWNGLEVRQFARPLPHDHPRRPAASTAASMAAATVVSHRRPLSTPACWPGRSRAPRKPSSSAANTRSDPNLLSATSTWRWAIKHWRSSPPCCSPRCRPSRQLLQRNRPRRPPGWQCPGRPTIVPGTPNGPLTFFASRRRCCAPRQAHRGCYPRAAANPAAASLLAFTLDRAGCRSGIDAQGLLASSNPPSDAVRRRRATQDFQTNFPYTWLRGASPSGRVVGALLQLLPRPVADSHPNRKLQRMHSLPGRKRR